VGNELLDFIHRPATSLSQAGMTISKSPVAVKAERVLRWHC
jgi:hypothetical protein